MYYRPDLRLDDARGEIPAVGVSRSNTGANPLLRDRRLIAENAVFKVYFDHLVYPDGTHVSNYLSVVPRTLTARGLSGVAVLPEVNGRLGLLQVTRHPLNTSLWEMPRGFIDRGESAMDEQRKQEPL